MSFLKTVGADLRETQNRNSSSSLREEGGVGVGFEETNAAVRLPAWSWYYKCLDSGHFQTRVLAPGPWWWGDGIAPHLAPGEAVMQTAAALITNWHGMAWRADAGLAAGQGRPAKSPATTGGCGLCVGFVSEALRAE